MLPLLERHQGLSPTTLLEHLQKHAENSKQCTQPSRYAQPLAPGASPELDHPSFPTPCLHCANFCAVLAHKPVRPCF